ncbi:hypothetical protein I3F58_01300 [Streptomyces sp. MUM 203J]|uniref:hypothetical protein n=1 Tax=Streptomyces sp. MUM 203J TaxID=2791990 RepID=UPI001F039DA9|nr:hypothetical protein [Streptomyces sp. MUM 203J]MCH0538216.1 hypothetical protein [Streptomyces sp. MUM 203J]
MRLAGPPPILPSLVPAAGGCPVFDRWLPHDRERYEAGRAAEARVPQAPARPWEDGLRDVTFTVQDVENRRRDRRATVSGGPFRNGDVLFGDPGPVLRHLAPGGRDRLAR